MTKKILVFLAAILLLTGCGPGADPESAIPSTPALTSTSTPSPSNTPFPTNTRIPPTETPASPLETGTVVDFDLNEYGTVKIGNQWWMSESLLVTENRQGGPITRYCYNNDEANCAIYGGLYTWDTTMNGATEENAQGICPDGWHIPGDADWAILFEYLGGINIAGGKMKSTGTELWKFPNRDATNSSGFSGLPAGGYMVAMDLFEGVGHGVHFWSSTEDGEKAGLPTLHYREAEVTLLSESKQLTASVRCVQD